MITHRELDARIAQEVFGFRVWEQDGELHEGTLEGPRPLRRYTRDIQSAWEVADKMRISLIPIAGGQWFAFVAHAGHRGWESPQALLAKLESGDFTACGASLSPEAPFAICQAAVNALEKRKFEGPGMDTELAPVPPELLN